MMIAKCIHVGFVSAGFSGWWWHAVIWMQS